MSRSFRWKRRRRRTIPIANLEQPRGESPTRSFLSVRRRAGRYLRFLSRRLLTFRLSAFPRLTGSSRRYFVDPKWNVISPVSLIARLALLGRLRIDDEKPWHATRFYQERVEPGLRSYENRRSKVSFLFLFFTERRYGCRTFFLLRHVIFKRHEPFLSEAYQSARAPRRRRHFQLLYTETSAKGVDNVVG